MRDISDATFERLKSHAEPLVDTIDSVINRALDALEQSAGKARAPGTEGGGRLLSPVAPPNLAHTTVRAVEVSGKTLPPSETYWNAIVVAVLREGKAKGLTSASLKSLVIGNCMVGQKEDEGYKHYKDLGLSIQGQDSNAAWRAAYHVAKALSVRLKVVFVWQNNPRAAFPGETGTFIVAP